MPAPPPVSICLVSYNRADTLPRSLDSLLAQSFADFELIISDDCSTDATEEICRDYAARDPRVRYFRNDKNLNMPGNLNAAIARARGGLIANLHDGDFFRADLIQKWTEALSEVPSAAFVFNQYASSDARGNPRIHSVPFGLRVDGAEIARHFFRTFSSCVWGTVMTRRSAYQEVGPFDPAYGSFADVDMWLRLAKRHDVAYVAEPLITLLPREPGHPYAFVNWRAWFWTFAMYVANLELYRDRLPAEVPGFRSSYARRRRRILLRDVLVCVKYRRWDRLREGLALFRDADDSVLRALGRALGRPGDAPAWYSAASWRAMSVD